MYITQKDELELVLLITLIELEGNSTKRKVLDHIESKKYFCLDKRELKLRKNNEEKWRNDLAWTRNSLKRIKCLEMPFYGVWAINEKGWERAKFLFYKIKGNGLEYIDAPLMLTAAKIFDEPEYYTKVKEAMKAFPMV